MMRMDHQRFRDVYMWVVDQTIKFLIGDRIKLHVWWWSRCGRYCFGDETLTMSLSKWNEFKRC